MDGRYPPGIMITLSDCTDASREIEFNNWYNQVLIPSMAELKFLRHAKRFENVLANTPTYLGRPKYLAVWEVYHNNLAQARETIISKKVKLQETGKDFNGMVKMVDAVYANSGKEQRTERTGRPVKGVYIVLCLPLNPLREDEFNKWYDDRHGPDILGLGLQDTCYRYKVVNKLDLVPFRHYYFSLYEMSMDPLEALQKLASHRPKWFADPVWVELLGTTWNGAFRQIYPI